MIVSPGNLAVIADVLFDALIVSTEEGQSLVLSGLRGGEKLPALKASSVYGKDTGQVVDFTKYQDSWRKKYDECAEKRKYRTR